MEHERIIKLDGPMNFRDLGGYHTTDGHSTKWNIMYRADDLSRLSFHDRQKLSAMNVTVDCDLRSSFEQMVAPDKHWPNVKYVDAHVYAQNGEGDDRLQIPGVHSFPDMLSSHSQEAVKIVMQELLILPQDEALVFHCSAGKDRTGMIAALILSVLGVDDETIIKDYLLTNQLYSFAREDQITSNDKITQMVAKMNVTKGDGPVMQGFLQTIHDGWGTTAQLFKQQLDFSTTDLQQFRQKFLV